MAEGALQLGPWVYPSRCTFLSFSSYTWGRRCLLRHHLKHVTLLHVSSPSLWAGVLSHISTPFYLAEEALSPRCLSRELFLGPFGSHHVVGISPCFSAWCSALHSSFPRAPSMFSHSNFLRKVDASFATIHWKLRFSQNGRYLWHCHMKTSQHENLFKGQKRKGKYTSSSRSRGSRFIRSQAPSHLPC